jgi:hypothetical protein
MVNMDLTPEEISWVLRWYEEFPQSPSDTEGALVDKLRAAQPPRTVDVPLSSADIARLRRWYSQSGAENSNEERADDELLNRLLASMEPFA